MKFNAVLSMLQRPAGQAVPFYHRNRVHDDLHSFLGTITDKREDFEDGVAGPEKVSGLTQRHTLLKKD